MEVKIHSANSISVAEVCEYPELLSETSHILDIMANAQYNGAGSVIINKSQLHPDFFDLKTGLAGEILQKFSNYRMRLAIIGDFSKIRSKSLTDFIRESNRTGRIIFVPTLEEAKKKLCGLQ